MKKLLCLTLALFALLALAPVPELRAATKIPGVKVAATQANTATDFAADVESLCIYNAGTKTIFYSLGGAATATAGTNEIPPGLPVCFSGLTFSSITEGVRVAVVGIICAAGETSTVYLYATTR